MDAFPLSHRAAFRTPRNLFRTKKGCYLIPIPDSGKARPRMVGSCGLHQGYHHGYEKELISSLHQSFIPHVFPRLRSTELLQRCLPRGLVYPMDLTILVNS